MTYLWTPWRATYMQAKKEKSRCIFCEAAEGSADEETLVVYRGELSFVILNRYPYTSGHLMIAPYIHVSRLTDVSEATSDEIMRLTRTAEAVIEGAYRPDGLNLGMNLGEAAGAGIEQHIHMHVLPRWAGDANFMTSVASTRIIPESLDDTYAKIKEGFAETLASNGR
jgi:ATP adenylyltransferase